MSHLDDHLHLALTELGEPDAVFRISTGRFVAKLLLGGGLVLFGLVLNYFWWFRGPARIGHVEILLLFVPPLLGVSLLHHLYRQRGLTVLLYPAGLLWLQRGKAQIFPWPEVAAISLHMVRSRQPVLEYNERGELTSCVVPPVLHAIALWKVSLTLIRYDGEHAVLTPALSRFDELATEIQRRTFPQMWHNAWILLERSPEPLSFGPWQLSRQGLHTGNDRIPWSEFHSLQIANGKLLVRRKGRWKSWRSIEVHTVPNLHLFWALVEELRRNASAVSTSSGGRADAATDPGRLEFS